MNALTPFFTIIISVLFGVALRNVFGFWEALCLAFVIQIIVAFSISSLRINRVQRLTGEFEVWVCYLFFVHLITYSLIQPYKQRYFLKPR